MLDMYSQWLVTNNEDIIARTLSAITVLFSDKDKFKKIDNGEEKKDDTPDILENGYSIYDIKHESYVKLMKSISLIEKKSIFWERIILGLQTIASQLSDDIKIVECFIEFARFIMQDDLEYKKNNGASIVNFYELNLSISSDSVLQRKKENVLIQFIESYVRIISKHLVDVKKKEEKSHSLRKPHKKVDSDFNSKSFSLIIELSKITHGSYRENLSYKCIELLFKYSRYTQDMLKERVKESLHSYINEIDVLQNLYPKNKKKEVYIIMENLTENLFLVKDLKDELIDCLSSKDFYVIEKVKECLKKGL